MVVDRLLAAVRKVDLVGALHITPARAALGLSEKISPYTIAVAVRGDLREVRGSVTHSMFGHRSSMDNRGMVVQIALWLNWMLLRTFILETW